MVRAEIEEIARDFCQLGYDSCEKCLRPVECRAMDYARVAYNRDYRKVVLCKDCKHWGGVIFGQVCRIYSGIDTRVCTEGDHFCSRGERIEQ